MARKNMNIILRCGIHSEIITANGDRILVDTSNLPIVSQYSWHVTTRGYAATRINGRIVYMHRMLMCPGELQVDHINQNKLDNRRFNLRIVTNQQNHFNRPLNSNNSSGVTGVYWNRDCQKWCAQITINGKTISGGLFHDFEDAVLKRMELEEIHFIKKEI